MKNLGLLSGLFLSLCMTGSMWGQNEDLPFSNSRFMAVEGTLLHYRHWESGGEAYLGKMLLVHGFCGSTFSWRHNIEAFTGAGYEVFAVDLPPFGYSDRKPDANHSASFQADLLWKLLENISPGDAPWVLVGHSMGSSVISAMAAVRPMHIKALIMVDAAIYSTRSEQSWLRRKIFGAGPVQGLVEAVAKLHYFRFPAIKRLLADAYATEPDSSAVDGYLDPLKLKKTASGILDITAYSEEIFSFHPNDVINPVLLIWGEKDTWVPIEKSNRLLDEFPAVTIKTIPEGGHCPMETHPDTTNGYMLDFLRWIESL